MNKDRLFWEKYRPNTLNDMILPDRIRNIVKHGISTNFLFVGSPGIGKTTAAKILVKSHSHIVLNSKLGVDVLRNEVLNFCSTKSDMFSDVKSDIKVVYLEEFDSATRQLQDELRAFIEQYEKHVRFIATCNNLNKIIEPMQSRFEVLDFNPISVEESKQMKIDFVKRLIQLNETEKLNLESEAIKNIVKNHFPDLRKCMTKLQLLHLTGSIDVSGVISDDTKLYDIIDSDISEDKVWDYLYANWMDRLDSAFQAFGKEYWIYIQKNRPELTNKMIHRMIKISEYVDSRLPNSRDPFVTLFALVSELKKI